MAIQDGAATAASWLGSDNVDTEVKVKGDRNVTWRAESLGKKKWHCVPVLFVFSTETMRILIDLQNLVAIIMEHKPVALEADLPWQEACKALRAALGSSC